MLKYIKERLDKQSIEKYRTEGTYTEFKMIVNLCLKSMVSVKHWKRNKGQLEISGMVTVADEALALLVLENNIEEWIEKAKGNNIDKNNRLTKYTNKGIRHNGTRKGWCLEGLKRFNTIFKEIKLERDKETSRDREAKLLQEWGSDGSSNNRTEPEGQMEAMETAEEEIFVSESDFNYE